MTVTHTSLEEQLSMRGIAYGTTCGDSMEPLLHDRRQTIVLSLLPARARKHDVILVKRADGHFVLHRVIRVLDTGYLTRGDNRFRADAPVSDGEVLARLDGYYRGENFVSVTSRRYRAYLFFWVKNPLRFAYLAARAAFHRLFRRKPAAQ